jgi:hypothetical protein
MPETHGETVPVAILLHGLSTDSRWCDDIAWCLAEAGIASVRFDFAGSGYSTGTQEAMTVTSQVSDTIAILDYVKSLDFADTDNIFLVGKSMGGVDAVLATDHRSQDIKALCLWYPGFGVGDAVSHGLLLGQTFDPDDLPETLTAVGYTYGRNFLREVAALDCADVCSRITQPVYILHGDQDYIAPISYSFQLSTVFPDCTLELIPGGGHGFWGEQERHALESMRDFLLSQID